MLLYWNFIEENHILLLETPAKGTYRVNAENMGPEQQTTATGVEGMPLQYVVHEHVT